MSRLDWEKARRSEMTRTELGEGKSAATTARFDGRCAACGARFAAGSRIIRLKGRGWRHTICPAKEV